MNPATPFPGLETGALEGEPAETGSSASLGLFINHSKHTVAPQSCSLPQLVLEFLIGLQAVIVL